MTGGDEKLNKQRATKIDVSSPYYLGSNDNPSNTITNVVFLGDNYEEWSRSIRFSLMARKKFGFLDGSKTKPTDDEKLVDWSCVQAMLVQWIMHTLDKSVKKSIPYFEEAKPLWDVMKDRFSIGNGPRIQQIKLAVAECRQSKTMYVVDYFGQLQILWDELGTYDPIPACSCGGCKCGGCKCNIPKQLQKRVDEEQFHQFLYGINEELYGNVRSNLLSQDPFPSLARAYQTLLQEEQLRISTRVTPKQDIMALAVKSQSSNRGTQRYDNRDKSELLCSYCNRTRHDVENFFAKNVFPDWWGDRHRNGRGSGKGKGVGAGDFPQPTSGNIGKRRIAEVRATVAGSSVPANGAGLLGMTSEQWKHS